MHDAQTSILSRGGAALFRWINAWRDFRQAALWLGHRRRRDFRLLSLRFVHVRALGCRNNPATPQTFRLPNLWAAAALSRDIFFPREHPMPETRTQNSDFNRAFGDAKKQAANVAGEVQDAAEDIYGQARDSASSVADATKTAARKTAGSFEKALRNTVETQPYTAVAIALGLGWLFGRMHRPL
jgi:ElaB/YqjD/DUF883 family membrane-anchored ribosome-binding protein